MHIHHETLLAAPFESVAAAIRRPDTMRQVALPLVAIDPVGRGQWPPNWEDHDYEARVRLFGIVPFGRQLIAIRFLKDDRDVLEAQDNGSSALFRRWTHLIRAERATADTTHYADMLDIDAGRLTPFAGRFVDLLFRHRQRRLRALARRGFAA